MRQDALTTSGPSRGPAPSERVIRLSLLVAVIAMLGYLGDWHWLLDLCAHFRWQYLLAMLPGLVVAVLLRRPVAAALLLVATLLNVWSLTSATGPGARGADPPSPEAASLPSSPPDRWKLLMVNIHFDNRDLAPLLALIEAESPDVIGILELSPRAAAALAGLGTSYPVNQLTPRDDPFGIGLWSRLPGAHIEAASVPPLDLPTLRLHWNTAQSGSVWLVHPFPPIGGEATAWRDVQLAYLATQLRGDGDAILAGDLNTTPWSAAYRRLRLVSGLQDSSAGRWPRPTWFGPNLAQVLAIPIDHVLHGDAWRVLGHRVGPDVGSDHRPVIVEFARP